MTTEELMKARSKAWDEAKAFVESRRGEDGTLSEDDVREYEKMEEKVKNLGSEVERAKRMEEMDREMSRPVSRPITSRPEKAGRGSEEYRNAMLTAIRTKFRNVSNVLQEGVDADGGYLVPEEYDARLIQTLDEENIMRKLGTKITTGGEHKINIAATRPAAAWIEEGESITFADATFEQVLLDAHKLHVAIKVTEELLYDNAFNLESYILDQFGKALANAEEDAFLNGTGSGQPLGLFAETGGGTVADTVSELTGDSVIDLIYALKRPYRKRAKFIVNDKNLALIRKLKDDNGSYLWQPSYLAGEPDKLFGYDVYTSAYAPEDAIAFGDFSYYNIGDRGTRSILELRELFAGNGMIGYVAKERVDGKLILPEAVQILKISAE